MGNLNGIRDAINNDPVGTVDKAKDVGDLAGDVADSGIADIQNQKVESAKAKAGLLLDILGIMGGSRAMSGASIDVAKSGVNNAIEELAKQKKRIEDAEKEAGIDEPPPLPDGEPEGAGGNDDAGSPGKPGKGGAIPAVAGTKPPKKDPLVLDLDGDGIETTSPSDGSTVLFDLDDDGVKSGTGWIKPDDGWLVLDRNGNGAIDSGRELFGVDTIKQDGTKAVDGFDALKDLDENNDGMFTVSDSKFQEVRVWRDLNQDGISQEGELISLDEAGIVSIAVSGENIRTDLGNGNIQTAVGSYIRTDGHAGSIGATSSSVANLDLLQNTFYREFTDKIEISQRATELPELLGSGRVRDLSEAMTMSSALADLVEEYSSLDTRDGQQGLLDNFIELWADTSEMKPLREQADSLSPYGVSVNYNLAGLAQGSVQYNAFLEKLGVVERFMGFTYGGPRGELRLEPLNADSGNLNISLSSEQMANISLAYERFKTDIYESLLLRTRFYPYIEDMVRGIAWNDQTAWIDSTLLEQRIENSIQEDPRGGLIDLLEFSSAVGKAYFDRLGWDINRYLMEKINEVSSVHGFTEELSAWTVRLAGLSETTVAGSSRDDLLVGGAASDTLYGRNGDDLLVGREGDDRLYGENGDDFLNGGIGNDYMAGGAGSDTYYFGRGAGQDVIDNALGEDVPGRDVLVLTELTPDDVEFSRDGFALVITIIDTGDKITIRNWGDGGSSRLQEVRFIPPLDSSVPNTSWGIAEITAATPFVLGTSGDDSLYAWVGDPEEPKGLAGDDKLYGNNLANQLEGGSGDDRLDGGLGADVLIGGAGNDEYVVNEVGDIIVELANEGVDKVYSAISYTLDETNIENLELVGASNLNGTGNALNNIITGNSGNNILNGGAGADTLIGGVGNDSYYLDNSADVVIENPGEGIDTVVTGLSHTLGANVENLTLTGSADTAGTGNELNNALIGNAGNNVLIGMVGNDFLDGGAGRDILIGGAGDDTYVVDSTDDLLIEFAGEGTDTVRASLDWTLGSNFENLTLTGDAALNGTGNELANVLTGNSVANTLVGLAGNDTLDGGTGADTLIGGTGDDHYIVDNVGDAVIEQAGEGIDTVHASLSWTLGNNTENLILTDGANINGTGNELDNIITGNGTNNIIDGGTGADTMLGGGGDDTYIVENAGDTVIEYGGQGTDTIRSSLDWTLGANIENLVLTGSAETGTGNTLNNAITGTTGDNQLYGLAGNDVLDGAGGADLLVGGTGDDTYIVEGYDDTLVELAGEGTDTVRSDLTWALDTHFENLTLTGVAAADGFGNASNNVIIGNSATNTLYGYAGNDTLDGGAGDDKLIGGEGDDVYIVDSSGDVVQELAGEGNDLVKASASYALSENVENLILVGAEAINGAGNALNNVITGSNANNTLYGMAGDDVIDGGSGADTMVGGEGNDTYIVDNASDITAELAGEGLDQVQASVSYALGDNVENLTLTGGSSINGTGNALENTLTGNSGNNRLDGGSGADTMIGGSGNDTYVVDNTGDVVIEQAGQGVDLVEASIDYTLSANVENLTLQGSADLSGHGNALNNVITGNSGNNALYGEAGSDRLYGAAGNDLLDGGEDADIMYGGAGDDSYIVDNPLDVVVELVGAGTDTVYTSMSYTLGDNIENLVLTGSNAVNGTGNASSNQLQGNAAANILDGGIGADMLVGGAGDDTYIIDDVADVVVENLGEGSDTAYSSVDTTLWANVENLVLTGATREENLSGTGNALDNIITGNAGANILAGGGGNDLLIGGNGDDVYHYALGDGNDRIDDASGLDRIVLGAGIYPGQIHGFRDNGEAVLVMSDGGTIRFAELSKNVFSVETIEFADGTIWQSEDLRLALNASPSGDLAIVGDVRQYETLTVNNTLADADGLGALSYQWQQSSDGILWTDLIGATGTSLTLTDEALVGQHLRVVANYVDANSTDETFAGTATLPVENVNDAPTLTVPLADMTTLEDAAFSFVVPTATFADVDVGDTLSYTATLADGSVLPSWLSFDAATRTLSGTPENADVGVIAVKVIGTDSGGKAVSDVFNLTVGNANDAPTVNFALADQTADEDIAFSFTVPADTFADVDAGDALSYSAKLADGTSLPSWLSFNAATRTFSGTPVNADVGILNLQVTATDLSGEAVSSTFALSINNVNDAPTVAVALANRTTDEDTLFSFTVPAGTFADVDAGDSLSYAATLADGSGLPSWLNFDAATRTFSGTPGNDDVGVIALKVTATDLAGESVSSSFNLTVSNVNDAPTVNVALADQTTDEDVAFSFTVPAGTFADIDVGDTLSYVATLGDGSALPSWLNFNAATRTFSGTPANAEVGGLSLKVTATDSVGASVSSTFNLTVNNVNDAPTVAIGLANQATNEDAPFSFVLATGTFSDIDVGDTLTYAATLGDGSALPSWLSFDAATRTFSGTPGNGDVGGITLKLTATDSVGASVSSVFTLTVNNVNDAPTTGTPLINQTVSEDSLFSYVLPADVFSDIDAGDTLSLSATLSDGSLLPSWLSFNAATLTFSGTPGNADVGAISLVVTATDLAGETASSSFDLSVLNVNDAPVVVTPVSDLVTLEDSPFTFTVPLETFADIDVGDTLSYSATLADGSVLPSWVSFDAATRTFAGTPGNAEVGLLSFKVTATDAIGAQVSTTFGLTIQNINDAPVLAAPIATQHAVENSLFSFTVAANTFQDIDIGDNLSYTATLDDGSALPSWLTFDAATQTFSGTPLHQDVGSLGLKVMATDSYGATATANFTLGIANDNYAPVVATPIDTQWATEDFIFSYTIPAGTFLDANPGDVLGYQLTLANGNPLPSWLSFNAATRTLTGTPPNTAAGIVSLQVVATDPEGLSATALFSLDIANHIVGNGDNNNLTGTSLRDYIEGRGDDDTLYGGDGDDYLDGGSGADRLYGGAGNDTLYGGSTGDDDDDEDEDDLYGGTGDDTYIIDRSSVTVREYAGEGIDTVKSSISYTLGSNVENLTLTGSANRNGTGNSLANILIGNSGNNTLNAGAGNDILDGGTGNDILIGGTGNDTYILGRGYGSDTIQENDSTAGNTDVASFLEGIATDQLWFRHVGNNLEVSVIGTADKLTIQNWYSSSANNVEQFRTADGHVLLDSQVENLVQAMAAFAPPAAGQTTLPQTYQSALAPVLAANWQ